MAKASLPLNNSTIKNCSIDDCGKGAYVRGFCATHYSRLITRGDPLTVSNHLTRTTEERFWTKVDKRGAISPALGTRCWLWMGCRGEGRNAYGHFRIGKQIVKAHRYSFYLAYGTLPLVGRHRCDNPPCVNPAHIANGTVADNNRDRDTRGRHRALRGEQNANAKLTREQVQEIRAGWPQVEKEST